MRCTYVDDPHKLRGYIEAFRHKVVALDIETECAVPGCESTVCEHALDPRTGRIVDIGVACGDQVVIFPPSCAKVLSQALEPAVLVLQNFKFDFKMLNALIDLPPSRFKIRDTMLMHHLVDENSPHGLDHLIQVYYQDDYKEKFWAKYKKYTDAPRNEQLEYNASDLLYTLKLLNTLELELELQEIPASLVQQVHDLALALYQTEQTGILVDLEYCVKAGTELTSQIIQVTQEARELCDVECTTIELATWAKEIEKAWTPTGKKWKGIERPEFNFGSSAQVVSLLYSKLRLPAQFNPKTKAITADDAALIKLEGLHPVVSKLRQLRKFSKMKSAFVDGVLERVHDGRIYPKFNVNGTVTGRISHQDPNMGQIPSRGEWVKIRGIFIPSPGNVIVTADYGQLEVCIAAHFSGDKNLLRIVMEGISQHDITAESLKIQREDAKKLNFAMQYLCSPYKISQLIHVSMGEATHIWNKYWETYKGLKRFIDWCVSEMEAGRPFVNPFGRKRRIELKLPYPHYVDTSKGNYAREHRQGVNSIIQGTGADATSKAFVDSKRPIEELGGRMWFTVHDELLGEVPKSRAEQAQAALKKAMLYIAEYIKLTVPLKVETKVLDRWGK